MANPGSPGKLVSEMAKIENRKAATTSKPVTSKAAARQPARSQPGKNAAMHAAPPGGRGPGRRSAEAMLDELRRRLLEINDLAAAGAVLSWDQATYMPNRGARARGRQSATLHRLAHEQLIDPSSGKLPQSLQYHAAGARHFGPAADG